MSAREELVSTYRCKILSCFWVRRDVIPGDEVPPNHQEIFSECFTD
jgi:hypothetical protein